MIPHPTPAGVVLRVRCGVVSLVPDQVDVLIVAAHAPALGGLRAALGDHLYGVLRDLRVIAKTVGIGGAVASAQTTRRLLQVSPRSVIEIGACGAYPGLGFEPSDLVVGTRVDLLDSNVSLGRAAFPEPMQTVLETNPMLSEGIAASIGASARRGVVGSPPSTTRDAALAQGYHAAHLCVAESLEAFSIASACALARIPYTCVLGISHELGPTARDQGSQFERPASEAAAHAVIAWINKGAHGLPHGRA